MSHWIVNSVRIYQLLRASFGVFFNCRCGGGTIRLNLGIDNSLDDGYDFPWVTALSLGNYQVSWGMNGATSRSN